MYAPDEGPPAAVIPDLVTLRLQPHRVQHLDAPVTEDAVGVHARTLLRDRVELKPLRTLDGELEWALVLRRVRRYDECVLSSCFTVSTLRRTTFLSRTP